MTNTRVARLAVVCLLAILAGCQSADLGSDLPSPSARAVAAETTSSPASAASAASSAPDAEQPEFWTAGREVGSSDEALCIRYNGCGAGASCCYANTPLGCGGIGLRCCVTIGNGCSANSQCCSLFCRGSVCSR